MTGTLMAAFGKVNITPEETMPLQGYDPFQYAANPATDILDDLYARIVVLDDGPNRCVIVCPDCGLSNEDFVQVPDPSGRPWLYRGFSNTFPSGTRRSWAEAAGTMEDRVSVNATHTHSAPVHFSEKYTNRIGDKIRELTAALVPVRLKVGSGTCSISANRRPALKANDSLPVDRTLQVLIFESFEGKPIGSFVNCAVHPTIVWNKANRISSEMVGLAMNTVENEYGDGFVSLFLQGFTGDVGPLVCGPTSGWKEDTYPLVIEAGQRLYADIAETIRRVETVAAVPLDAMQTIVKLPTVNGFHRSHLDVTLVGIRIGDLAILTASGEIFNGYVGHIKPRSPFAHTLFCSLGNGYTGYLPTAKAFADGLGGYEMKTTPYTASACEPFTEAAVGLLERLMARD
ncbi:hypothetical protein [Paenibacillus ginsengarvi]|uniref:Uncharacterized protein n=1 Tax=Paenibacillus ginsengarvi TaxID=400777 RepID=A0A3B0B1Z3_9BACL|nr:hypothetical protein [Paenibacillus ginsengarvi]RKN66021.1 hypothetical protein D7M11_31580 [Paenibacillus ginsengarvi]